VDGFFRYDNELKVLTPHQKAHLFIPEDIITRAASSIVPAFEKSKLCLTRVWECHANDTTDMDTGSYGHEGSY